MPKNQKSPPRKKRNKKQFTLTECKGRGGRNALSKLPQEPLYILKNICMTDAIYENGPPEEMRGKLFHYLVTSYDAVSKTFQIQYRNRMIEEDGRAWIHNDGDRDSISGIKFDSVKKGKKLYEKAEGRVAAVENDKKAAAKAVLEKKVEVHEAVAIDMSDLEKAAESAKKGWRDHAMMEVDFEPTGEET